MLGAASLVMCGLISPIAALGAVEKGIDVYLPALVLAVLASLIGPKT